MRIEPAGTNDVDRLADLWVELATDQRRHGSHLRGPENRTAMRDALAAGVVEGTVLVARADGDDAGEDGASGAHADREPDAIVGFVTLAKERGLFDQDVTRGRIENVYVIPGCRDQGIGSRLLGAAAELLVDRGADVVAIEALAGNTGARDLYGALGYRPHRIEFEKAVANDIQTRDDR